MLFIPQMLLKHLPVQFCPIASLQEQPRAAQPVFVLRNFPQFHVGIFVHCQDFHFQELKELFSFGRRRGFCPGFGVRGVEDEQEEEEDEEGGGGGGG